MKTLLLLKNYFAFNGFVSSLMSAVKLSLIGATLLSVPGYAFYAHTKLQRTESELSNIKSKYEILKTEQNCDSIKIVLLSKIKNLKDSVEILDNQLNKRKYDFNQASRALDSAIEARNKVHNPLKPKNKKEEEQWLNDKPTTDKKILVIY